ncbi:Unknown protein, partial [Striga hermonthica]
LKSELSRLMNEHSSMESKLSANSAELERTTEAIRKLNKGKADLNELLSMGRQYGDLTGLGYTGNVDKSVHPSEGTIKINHPGLGFSDKSGIEGTSPHGKPSRNLFGRFVKSTVSKSSPPKPAVKVHVPIPESVSKSPRNFVPICHYCGVT